MALFMEVESESSGYRDVRRSDRSPDAGGNRETVMRLLLTAFFLETGAVLCWRRGRSSGIGTTSRRGSR